MVALDGNGRNASCLQALQRLLSLDERQRVNRALIEEIARDHDKVGMAGDSVVNDAQKRAGKVIEAFLQTILLVAQVIVCGMDKCHLHEYRLLRSGDESFTLFTTWWRVANQHNNALCIKRWVLWLAVGGLRGA